MSGVYWIHPPTSPTPFTVHCNYMVRHFIHMRYDADVDFNVTMAEYVTGFGDMMGDFWLGLEKLHLLTSSRHYTLGVQVSNFSEVYQHYYRRFVVKSAAEGYAMTFDTQYLPQAPALPMSDCLAPLKDIPFSAYDNDNDGNTTRNCAADYGGGWWYNADCSECNLMGTLRWSSLTRVPGAVDEYYYYGYYYYYYYYYCYCYYYYYYCYGYYYYCYYGYYYYCCYYCYYYYYGGYYYYRYYHYCYYCYYYYYFYCCYYCYCYYYYRGYYYYGYYHYYYYYY
nr:hypothetical protein BaRGS_027756 [Batillaria attramentaria]